MMATPEPNTVLEKRYELVEPLPDRGLGESWRARDREYSDRYVCVKLLRALKREEIASGRLPPALHEHLKGLRVFRHPNALVVLNHGLWTDRPFIVYDLFDGGSVGTALDAARMKNELLPLAELRAVFDRVCEVVAAAHESPRALLHLGIAPGSVMFRAGGDGPDVRVLDFGLGRFADVDPKALARSARAITCPAPEQLNSAVGAVSPATDVFALGGLLREMLALPPDHGQTLTPAGFDRRRDDVPEAVWEVIARATDPTPADRYATVRALRDALAVAWTQPLTPRTNPAPPVERESAERLAPPQLHEEIQHSPVALTEPDAEAPRMQLPTLSPHLQLPRVEAPAAAPATATTPEPVDFGATLGMSQIGLDSPLAAFATRNTLTPDGPAEDENFARTVALTEAPVGAHAPYAGEEPSATNVRRDEVVKPKLALPPLASPGVVPGAAPRATPAPPQPAPTSPSADDAASHRKAVIVAVLMVILAAITAALLVKSR